MPHVRRRNLREDWNVEKNMPDGSRVATGIALIALFIAACSSLGGGAQSPPARTAGATFVASPVASPLPATPGVAMSFPAASSTPVVVTHVGSASQAAAVVFASNPIFNSIIPDPGTTVGQTAWYTASDDVNGFVVSVTMGSGDCPAGCANNHTWNYAVSTSGKVTLASEQGPDVEPSADHGTPDPATVNIVLVAGPVCPVERIPPDPNCAPRPVPHVTVVLRDAAGNEVGTDTADDYGVVTFTVPAGAYYIEPGNVGGIMQAPTPTAFSVLGGKNVKVTLMYDTGIR
jgi:hypothetical protein